MCFFGGGSKNASDNESGEWGSAKSLRRAREIQGEADARGIGERNYQRMHVRNRRPANSTVGVDPQGYRAYITPGNQNMGDLPDEGGARRSTRRSRQGVANVNISSGLRSKRRGGLRIDNSSGTPGSGTGVVIPN